MKKLFLFNLFIIVLFVNCAKSQQYGVDVLKLDDFDFQLNIEEFFKDESIFRGTHDDFFVTTEEHTVKTDTGRVYFVQYSTRTRSSEKPLVIYSGIKFETLGLITDDADEKVWMVFGSTEYANEKQIQTIINNLFSEYKEPPYMTYSYNGTNLIFSQANKIASLYINVEMNTDYYNAEKELLTPEKYGELRNKLKNKDNTTCTLFITNSDFDKIIRKTYYLSGDLTRYK